MSHLIDQKSRFTFVSESLTIRSQNLIGLSIYNVNNNTGLRQVSVVGFYDSISLKVIFHLNLMREFGSNEFDLARELND